MKTIIEEIAELEKKHNVVLSNIDSPPIANNSIDEKLEVAMTANHLIDNMLKIVDKNEDK